jgi:hypothetical protein
MTHEFRSSFWSATLLNEVTGFLDLDLDGMAPLICSGGHSRRASHTGTKALMLAVLDNGITCYFSRTPHVRAEAECWVASRRERSPFAFAVVCETLGLEPDAVRAALKKMRRRNPAAPRAASRPRPNVRREGRLLASKAG